MKQGLKDLGLSVSLYCLQRQYKKSYKYFATKIDCCECLGFNTLFILSNKLLAYMIMILVWAIVGSLVVIGVGVSFSMYEIFQTRVVISSDYVDKCCFFYELLPCTLRYDLNRKSKNKMPFRNSLKDKILRERGQRDEEDRRSGEKRRAEAERDGSSRQGDAGRG